MAVVDDDALRQLFLDARTHRKWLEQPVDDALLRRVYDLARWPPTSGNSLPMRLVFVRSAGARERLRPALDSGNVEQTMTAPVTAIVAHDTRFFEAMAAHALSRPELAARFGAAPEAVRERLAFQGGTLQGRLSDPGRPGVGPRLRSDGRLRPRQGGRGVLSGRPVEVELSRQPRLRRSRGAAAAGAAARLRRRLPDRVTLPDLVVRSRRVVTDGQLRPAAVHIRTGRIVGVLDFEDVPAGCPVDDAGDAVVMPGVVDTHVHVNEPGRTEWEGFDTASRAAAAGGVTTIVDMPLNSIPATTTVAGLDAKRRAAEGQCFVDVGFWGGVVPGNVSELEGLVAAGVLGFKCFLVPSGVDEFPAVTEADLRIAMPVLAKLGVPLLVHAELPGPIEEAARHVGERLARVSGRTADARSYATYLATRPKQAENDAIALAIALCREYRRRAPTSCTCRRPRDCRCCLTRAPLDVPSPSRPVRTI